MTQQQIYHLNEQGRLEPMNEEPFALEGKLQELVAEHPGLLSGEQMNPGNPRRFILIDREQGIADIIGGNNRWSLDHLLIDQDAIPTLVEAKRSANSQIRREIVGQMMDYAAHATQTWNVGDIRQAFEERAADPDAELAKLLQEEPDVEKFWQDVETNLRASRIRLLFVADGIPDELTRVVEFLNEQMPGIEVLAVEIKQFKGDTGSTLVPRIIGRTAEAVGAPSRSSGGRSPMDLEAFIARIPSSEGQQAAGRLLAVANERGARINRGTSGYSIRTRTPAFPRREITVAWLWPMPGQLGFGGTRDFSFGAGNADSGFFESLPDNLRQLLESWTDQFDGHPGTVEISAPGIKAYAFSHQAAAANIDLLAERLDRVLRELAELRAPDG